MTVDDLNKVTDSVCRVLKIGKPEMEWLKDEDFPSATMLAMLTKDGSGMALRENREIDFDMVFSVCHELRHVWQIRKHYHRFMREYKARWECETVEEYNLQAAEIDANAFAAIVMINMFGVEPLFAGFPDGVKEKIMGREREIIRKEFEIRSGTDG